jgi:hypothetical protein
MSKINLEKLAAISPSKLALATKRKDEQILNEFLYSIDETPDFHDPYSDLNLFLSHEIKEEMQHCGLNKKWSTSIQERLLKKISPEFQKRFPKYRLGITALKKTWEKIAFYTDQIQEQKEALTQDGKLNIYFLIKENLKKFHQQHNCSDIQPYTYASQLAFKMSECIAAIDGKKPKFDQLTKTIWGIQRHLLKNVVPSRLKSPYDENDRIDKFIVKTLLELTALDHEMSQPKLEDRVKEQLRSFLHLPIFAATETLTCHISALLADKYYPTSAFHHLYDADEKQAIYNFLKRHLSLYENSSFSAEHLQMVRRAIAIYMLASTMPKDVSSDKIKEGIEALYPIVKENRPPLEQSIYAFISSELLLYRNASSCYSQEFVVKSIIASYEEAKRIPRLPQGQSDMLDIIIWKILSEREGMLEQLPFLIGRRIEQEIAKILIDYPQSSFQSIVKQTLNFFKMIKELSIDKKWGEIEQKVHNWSLQGDMLCRWIRIRPDHPILRIICKKQKEQNQLSHLAFVSAVLQEYLQDYPHLSIYSQQIMMQIWIVYKYAWYTLFSTEEESSFERFLKWHLPKLKEKQNGRSEDELLVELSLLVKRILPVFSFDFPYWRKRLFPANEKPHAENDERYA